MGEKHRAREEVHASQGVALRPAICGEDLGAPLSQAMGS